MKRAAIWSILVAAAVSALAGCSNDSKPLFDSVGLSVSADWNFMPAAADQVGYVYTVLLNERTQNHCPSLPASLVITVAGQTLPLTLDAYNCLATNFTSNATLQPTTVTVTAAENGRVIAQGTFDNLTPGAGASLASPADGMVHAGDDVVVAPPPQLPSSDVLGGFIFPLEGDPWPGSQNTAGFPDREADGVHAQMPTFSGRAALVFHGSPFVPDAIVSCDGFADCSGYASNVLGPVIVTEGM